MNLSRIRSQYEVMTVEEFVKKKNVVDGEFGTASYRSISWSPGQAVEWEETCDASRPTVVRKRVTHLLVMRYEQDFPDPPEEPS